MRLKQELRKHSYGDQHPRFGIKGGENDVKELSEYLKVLLDIGFLNPQNLPIVSFEVEPLADESSEVVIANAKRVLREAWIRVNKRQIARGVELQKYIQDELIQLLKLLEVDKIRVDSQINRYFNYQTKEDIIMVLTNSYN